MAQTPRHPSDNSAQFPSKSIKSLTTSGSYLAARHAASNATPIRRRRFTARRCAPIRRTTNCSTVPSSPRSPTATSTEAVKLADRILTLDKSNRVARLVVGVRPQGKEIRHRAAQTSTSRSAVRYRSGRDPAVGLASYGAGDASPRSPASTS